LGHKQGVEEPGRGGMELGGPSFLSVSRGLRSPNPGVTSCRREGREVRDRKQTASVAATCRERRASDSRFPPPSCILQPVTAKTRTTRSRKSKGRRANVGRRLNRCGTRWLMRTASSANDADPFVHGGPPGQPHGSPAGVHSCAIILNPSSNFHIAVTATFKYLYVFVVIELGTRKLLHINVTDHPIAAWTRQALRETISSDYPYRSSCISSQATPIPDFGRPAGWLRLRCWRRWLSPAACSMRPR
jgi:hypothetical protein